MNQRLLFCVCQLLLTSLAGCSLDMHPIPWNASAAERDAVARLKPLAENIAWNEEGDVISIDLAGNVADEHIDAIVELKRLETLNLMGTKITNRGVVQLSQLAHLTGLSLAWTDITDEAIDYLTAVESLKVLDLNHTAVSDDGIDRIKSFPHLHSVFLTGTRVTTKKVEELRVALPNCRIQQ